MKARGMKRKFINNMRGDSINSGAAGRSDMMGHVNVDLSTLPQKTLLSVGADLGKSSAGQQPTQVNQSIGLSVGSMGNAITNPMLLRDLWNGNVTLNLGEINSIAESDSQAVERSSYYWLSKLREVDEYRDQVSSHVLDGVPVATLKSMYQAAKGLNSGSIEASTVLQKEEFQRPRDKQEDVSGAGESKAGMMDEDSDDLPFRRIPFQGELPEEKGEEKKGEEAKQMSYREQMMTAYGTKSKYLLELQPFLPIVGASVLSDTRSERNEKSMNTALFSNLIREIQPGDPNINPLAMGVRIDEALRFNGENKIFDPVFPGGSLNIGAIPVTTERLMIEPSAMDDYTRRCISHRNLKNRLTAVDDYKMGLVQAAMKAMSVQTSDVQWVNGNKSVIDFQHSSRAFNTMPVPPDEWVNRRQIEGELPFQDNLLPAQGLFVLAQPFAGPLQPSEPFLPQTRKNITYNPPTRFGWNYGVPFQ